MGLRFLGGFFFVVFFVGDFFVVFSASFFAVFFMGFLLRRFSSAFSLRYSFVAPAMVSARMSLFVSIVRGRISLSSFFANSATIWAMLSPDFSMRCVRRFSMLASSCAISGGICLFFW